jgi:hypothetical protein
MREQRKIFFSFLFLFTGISGSLQCGHVVDGMPARIKSVILDPMVHNLGYVLH